MSTEVSTCTSSSLCSPTSTATTSFDAHSSTTSAHHHNGCDNSSVVSTASGRSLESNNNNLNLKLARAEAIIIELRKSEQERSHLNEKLDHDLQDSIELHRVQALQIQNHQDELMKLRNEVERREACLKKTKRELTAKERSAAKYQHETEGLEGTIIDLRAQLRQALDSAMMRSANISAMQIEKTNFIASMDSLKAELEAGELKLMGVKEKLVRSEDELVACRRENKEILEANDSNQIALNAVRCKDEERGRAQIEEHDRVLQSLRDMEQQLHEQTLKNSELRLKLKEREDVQACFDESVVLLKKLERHVGDLEHHKAKLLSDLKQSREDLKLESIKRNESIFESERISELLRIEQKEKELLQSDLTMAQSNLKKEQNNILSLRQENEDLKKKLSAAKRQSISRNESVGDYKKQIEEANGKAMSIRIRFQAQKTALEKELAQTQQRLEDMESQSAASSRFMLGNDTTLKGFEARIEELEFSVKTNQNENASLQQQVLAGKETILALEETIKSRDNAHQFSDDQFIAFKALADDKCDLLQSTIQEMKSKAKQLGSDLAVEQEKMRLMSDAEINVKAELLSCRNMVHELEKKLTASDAENRDLRDCIDHLASSEHGLESSKKLLEKELFSLREELVGLKKCNVSSDDHVAALRTELETSRSSSGGKSIEILRLEAKVLEMKEDKEKLKFRHDSLERELFQAKVDVHQTSIQLNSKGEESEKAKFIATRALVTIEELERELDSLKELHASLDFSFEEEI